MLRAQLKTCLKRWWAGVALFALLCLLVFAMPFTRRLLSVQLGGPNQWSMYAGLNGNYTMLSQSQLDDDAGRRFPNDVNVQATLIEQDYSMDVAAQKNKTTAYDDLLRRFPGQPWLIAARLRWTLEWMKDDRLGGDFEDGNSFTNPSNYISPSSTTPPIETSKNPSNFSKADLEAAIAVARQGIQLEPDNNYFDGVLSLLLLYGRHDSEAYQALHTGSLKTRCDEHHADLVRAIIAAHQHFTPLLIEDKIALSGDSRDAYLDKYRHFAFLIAWQAWKAERLGDHATALQLGGDLARLSAAMMGGNNNVQTAFAATNTQIIAWSDSPSHTLRRKYRGAPILPRVNTTQRSVAASQLFAGYATAHGRPDLAHEALQQGQEATRIHTMLTAPNTLSFGPGMRTLPPIMTYWWLDMSCLWQIPLCMALAAAGSVLLIATRPRPVAARDLAMSVGACTLLALAFSFGCIAAGLGDSFLNLYNGAGPPANAFKAQIAVVCIAGFSLTPVLFGALWCGFATSLRMWRERRAQPAKGGEVESFSTFSIPVDMRPMVLTVMSISYLAGTLGTAGAALIAWTTHATKWTLPTLNPSDPVLNISDPATYFAVISAWLAVICYLGWLVKWRWLTPRAMRPFTHYGLRWYRQTLSIYILVVSVGFLAFALISLPARRTTDREFERVLRQGEIATYDLYYQGK